MGQTASTQSILSGVPAPNMNNNNIQMQTIPNIPQFMNSLSTNTVNNTPLNTNNNASNMNGSQSAINPQMQNQNLLSEKLEFTKEKETFYKNKYEQLDIEYAAYKQKTEQQQIMAINQINQMNVNLNAANVAIKKLETLNNELNKKLDVANHQNINLQNELTTKERALKHEKAKNFDNYLKNNANDQNKEKSKKQKKKDHNKNDMESSDDDSSSDQSSEYDPEYDPDDEPKPKRRKLSPRKNKKNSKKRKKERDKKKKKKKKRNEKMDKMIEEKLKSNTCGEWMVNGDDIKNKVNNKGRSRNCSHEKKAYLIRKALKANIGIPKVTSCNKLRGGLQTTKNAIREWYELNWSGLIEADDIIKKNVSDAPLTADEIEKAKKRCVNIVTISSKLHNI